MKAPTFSFQWYPKDILTSQRVSMLTLQEEGAYRRALDHCWLSGYVPALPKLLARVIGKNCPVSVAKVVAEMFIPHPDDPTKLIHERLEQERVKQEEYRALQSRKSKAGHKKRWGYEDASGDASGITVPCPNDGFPIPIPIPIPNTTPNGVVVREQKTTTPSLPQVEEYFFAIGSSSEQARRFFDYNSDRDWMVGKSKIKNWQSFADKWKKADEQPTRKTTRAERLADEQQRIMDFATGADLPPTEQV